MTAEYIQNIAALAGRFPDRTVTLYFPDFDAEPPAGCLNQVFGAPVGVDADRWPTYPGLPALLRQSGGAEPTDDLRMEHVFTIDLQGLTRLGAPADARVMQLYISNAAYHEGWTAGTAHTRVAFLDRAEVAAGPFTGELPARSQGREARRFTLVAVTVPAEVFASHPEDSPLGALRTAIWKAPARLGGEPIWLQGDPDEDMDYSGDDEGDEGDEGDDDAADRGPRERPAAPTKPLGMPVHGGFFMQFDESFVDVNLGDCGVMYVFGDDAYFQCY